MSKIILKTEKRPTKVSDHVITKAVERAYSRPDNKHAGRYGHAKHLSGSTISQQREKK